MNEKLTPHPQADILRAIADGKTVERFIRPQNIWLEAGLECLANYPRGTFRIKPETITINGHEVPAPVREPLEDGRKYFIPDLRYETPLADICHWSDSIEDIARLKNGLIHLTSGAAIAHAEALLSFTRSDHA